MTDPRETIEQARVAVKNGDFAAALNLYDHFYEHALEKDLSFYGVRLSYCLEEWAALAEKYPEAKWRLEQKMAKASALLDETREPERFHDYQAICSYLKCPDKAVAKFMAVDKSDRELAKSIFKFIRDDLVAAKQWDICGKYLPPPQKQYALFRDALDGVAKINLQNSDSDEEFLDTAKRWFVRNMVNFLLILKNTGETEAYDIIYEQFSMDMMARGYDELSDEVDEKIGA